MIASRKKLALASSIPAKSRMSVPFGEWSAVHAMSFARRWRARDTPVIDGKSAVSCRKGSIVNEFIEFNDLTAWRWLSRATLPIASTVRGGADDRFRSSPSLGCSPRYQPALEEDVGRNHVPVRTKS